VRKCSVSPAASERRSKRTAVKARRRAGASARRGNACTTRPKAKAGCYATEAVTRFIERLPEPRRSIARRLRKAVRGAAAGIEESVKWGSPCYSRDGLVCAIMVMTTSVNLAFYKGAHLNDPEGRLEGTGKDMRHVKLRAPQQVDARRIAAWVGEAIALNQADTGARPRRSRSEC
jgi:hypothetical protein